MIMLVISSVLLFISLIIISIFLFTDLRSKGRKFDPSTEGRVKDSMRRRLESESVSAKRRQEYRRAVPQNEEQDLRRRTRRDRLPYGDEIPRWE